MNDSDDEYEEETVHLVVDLGVDISPETLERLARENAEMLYLGTEAGEQYIQLGETTFRGQLDETVCTNLLFEVHEQKRGGAGLLPLLASMRTDEDDIDVEPHRQRPSEVSFYTATDHVALSERVTLLEKKESKPEAQASEGSQFSAQPEHEGQNYSSLL
ncbi:hypothetical protein BJV82DRAFT_628444 [Fennellomyces sp. T-0311]|nr:hypothetical protein BJV82DRAFT_628444 [Fennellomyces sp. T-0311]